MSVHIHQQALAQKQSRPDLQPGFTVRVHQRVQEGDKERVQIFEGLIIGVHKGHVPTDASITVRRIASGIGVEKVFPIHSPLIVNIEVKKVAKVRRAKLNFLRERKGKSARMTERFTGAGEFASLGASLDDETVATSGTTTDEKTDDSVVAEVA